MRSFYRGLDAVVGNPPYDVLAKRELSADLPPDRAAELCAYLDSLRRLIERERFAVLEPALVGAPFALGVQDVLVELVRRIIAIEEARGEIARAERSALAPAAQPFQDLIDRVLYAMAGLTPRESAELEARLSAML